ncbi:hypothetical protein [Bdellovibrio sp.]|uniref:RCC1 domain-containing protein n=1 Tax=Bdellovibrio TaxID=958 RepID=UPI0032221A89
MRTFFRILLYLSAGLALGACSLEASFEDLSQQLPSLSKDESFYADYPPAEISFLKSSDMQMKTAQTSKQEFVVTMASASPTNIYVRYTLIPELSTAQYAVNHSLQEGVVMIPAGSTEGRITYDYYGSSVGSKTLQVALKEVIGYPSFFKQQVTRRFILDPVQDDTFVKVSRGGDFACGISTAGALKCWGDNAALQMGAPGPARKKPAVVDSGVLYKDVELGTTAACAITQGGVVKCWGAGAALAEVDAPVLYKKITRGTSHACGITVAGVLKCWGKNDYAQMGTGSTSASTFAPTELDAGVLYKDVTAGAYHSCGITEDNELKCWGTNSSLQALGTGASPVAITTVDAGVEYRQVSAGNSHTCAITVGDKLKCWGLNTSGQVGDGLGVGNNAVTLIDTEATYSSVSAGASHTCAITKTDSRLKCWGGGDYGELGLNSTSKMLAPAQVSDVSYLAVSAGPVGTCGIQSHGVMFCWGENGSGQNGDGMASVRSVPIVVDGGEKYQLMDAGILYHVCGITTTGVLKCWGNNGNGQVGDKSTITKSFPVEVDRGIKYKAVSPGNYHTCGITVDGVLKCWGANGTSHRLGDGSTTHRSTPKAVDSAEKFIKVSAGNDSSCALTDQKKLMCWGLNDVGQLGNGTTDTGNIPQFVDSTDLFRDVVVSGGKAACALTEAGALKCWGGASHFVPGDVDAGTVYESLSRSGNNFCAKNQAGVFNCWSAGSYPSSFTALPADPGFTHQALGVGFGHKCALTSTQDIRCWGSGADGQLGNGQQVTQASPVAVSSVDKYSAISVGRYHGCGITVSGILHCWGSDRLNQLGAGRLVNVPSPTSP